jgi:hypothetical protein
MWRSSQATSTELHVSLYFISKYCHCPINFSWLITHHPNIRRTTFCPIIVVDATDLDFACFLPYSAQDPSLHEKKATVMLPFVCTVGELNNIHPSHFMVLGERVALHYRGTTSGSSGMEEFARSSQIVKQSAYRAVVSKKPQQSAI